MLFNEYIALSKPAEAANLCAAYGVDCDGNNPEELSEGLRFIVEQNGQKGLEDVMGIHPDKEILVQFAQSQKKHLNFSGKNTYGCDGCSNMGNDGQDDLYSVQRFNNRDSALGKVYGATGNATVFQMQNQTAVMLQQNTLIFIAIIVIGGALIFKAKSA